jgi:hypothetical protein
MHQEFPKFLYHRTAAPVIVAHRGEQEDLGAEWRETPAAFAEPEPEAETAPEAEPEKPKKRR